MILILREPGMAVLRTLPRHRFGENDQADGVPASE